MIRIFRIFEYLIFLNQENQKLQEIKASRSSSSHFAYHTSINSVILNDMLKKLVLAWLPAIAWMILIFALSSRQSVEVSSDFIINFFVFKSFHVIEYAILYFLVFRGFYLSKNDRSELVGKFAFIISLLYAITDEIHQTFVPTREGKLGDVFIDLIGITLAYIVINKIRIPKLNPPL